MVTRARKARERGKRKCEASESRGEAGEKAGKEGGTRPSSSRLSPVPLSANSFSPVLPSLDLTDRRGTARSLSNTCILLRVKKSHCIDFTAVVSITIFLESLLINFLLKCWVSIIIHFLDASFDFIYKIP